MVSAQLTSFIAVAQSRVAGSASTRHQGCQRRRRIPMRNLDKWVKNQNLKPQPAHPTSVNVRKWEGECIEIEIAKVEWHEKSRQNQALAFFSEEDESVLINGRPLQSRNTHYKVVVNCSLFTREPEVGEKWRVMVTNVMPTAIGALLFARPVEFLGLTEVLQKRRQDETDRQAHVLETWLTLRDVYVELHFSFAVDDRYDEQSAVTSRRYLGQLAQITRHDDGNIAVVLRDVLQSASGYDEGGLYETGSRHFASNHIFELTDVSIESDALHGQKIGRRGDWDVTTWRLVRFD